MRILINQLTSRLRKRLISLIGNDRYLPLQIDITNACNLRCTHCYHPHHKNTGALSFDQWTGILDQYDKLLHEIGFDPLLIVCGGEPTLSPHFNPLLEFISKRSNCRVIVLSNGTTTEHLNFKLLKSLDRIDFQISLEGPDALSHDLVRGSGSFERSMVGIQKLKSAGIPVHIQAVLSKRSSELIPEFFALAKQVKATSMDFTRLIVKGYAESLVQSGADQVLGPLDLREAYLAIIRSSAEFGVKTSVQGPLFHLLHPELGRSGRFAEGLVVDYKGRILASSRSRIELGNAIEDGLATVFFNHPLLKSIRRGDIEKCGQCHFFNRCGGDRNAAYAQTGNYLAADPGCWLETHRALTQRIKKVV